MSQGRKTDLIVVRARRPVLYCCSTDPLGEYHSGIRAHQSTSANANRVEFSRRQSSLSAPLVTTATAMKRSGPGTRRSRRSHGWSQEMSTRDVQRLNFSERSADQIDPRELIEQIKRGTYAARQLSDLASRRQADRSAKSRPDRRLEPVCTAQKAAADSGRPAGTARR